MDAHNPVHGSEGPLGRILQRQRQSMEGELQDPRPPVRERGRPGPGMREREDSVDPPRPGLHGHGAGLPFPDCSFDYVTAVHVLEHVEDSGMQTVADEILRVLRPGGFVFVRSFTPSDMRSGTRSGEGIRYVHRNPDGVAAFFRAFETEYARRVDDRTRFGTTRSRAECLFRKPLRSGSAHNP